MEPKLDMRAAFGAALVLVIGMGVGRFAFTGLLPLMISEGKLTVDGGSYAASANYGGYLVGALLLGLLPSYPSRLVCLVSMAASVAFLAVLGLPLPEWLIIAVRGIAGVASATGLVAASHWLIQDQRQVHGSPALFAGVGAGIFLSAELIVLTHMAGMSSNAIWLALGIGALAAALLSTFLLLAKRHADEPVQTAAHQPETLLGQLPVPRLILIYGLAGFGYIVTATYLPLLVRTALPSLDPVHVWAVFGLAAVPSCYLWHALHIRWGTRKALMANLLVQAVGVILPALAASPIAYFTGAVLAGGTFMGTVTIAMLAARRLSGTVRFNILGIMTASYACGQIAGPIAANALYGATASFNPSLGLAAGVSVAGAIACLGRSNGVEARA